MRVYILDLDEQWLLIDGRWIKLTDSQIWLLDVMCEHDAATGHHLGFCVTHNEHGQAASAQCETCDAIVLAPSHEWRPGLSA